MRCSVRGRAKQTPSAFMAFAPSWRMGMQFDHPAKCNARKGWLRGYRTLPSIEND
eukprot:CAMPEP_0184395246 /NCGR_PEP_ID=MMETSP0007-20130409/43375_1 /TAXON_ID=97485 /ORGANISM="Prymnesium parvum, Strain Texoma1" /LENGTH=54 /DNA_ID=CAMNT_0026747293 /DNA_START=299 /DNA_END=463 /DNA_ORIENTATION=-